MTQLLNLDTLTKTNREVTIRGKSYEVVDQTVDQMLNAANQARKQTKGKEEIEEVLSSMKQAVRSIIPDCPEEVIGSFNVRQCRALIEFSMADDEEVISGAEPAEAEDKKGEQPGNG